jgi:hypothetical protein
MKIILATLLLPSLIIISALTACAQDWKQIVPLKTTRAEVERLLGPSKGAYFGDYQLKEGALFIEYSSGPCRPNRKGGWNVPENIVVSMSFSPKHPKKLSTLKLDLTKYRKVVGGDTPTVTYYINDDEGIVYAIQQGKVDYVEYGPSKKFDDLWCKDKPI